VRRARRVVIVVDHTKLGVVTHGRIVNFSQIHLVITDSFADPEFLAILKDHGVAIILA
jgi:DeoR/GlpR family transcriptional regulator of sugar metabolism